MRKIIIFILILLLIPVASASAGLGTGGNITFDGNYVVHTFTSNGTFTPGTNTNISYLIVAGGGGGGGSQTTNVGAGGGGGGGIQNLSNYTYSVNAGVPLNIVVGSGGNGGAAGPNDGVNGSNSSLGTIIAIGGGFGAHYGANAGSGGSGGGTSTQAQSPGTGSQGGNGAKGSSGAMAGGGGGGGGTFGGNGVAASSDTIAGNAGIGTQININGTNTYYAGGGGGGAKSGTAGIGGNGGGGNGGLDTAGISGINGTGGGGGGGGSTTVVHAGGNGGSGIVIIRYLNPSPFLSIVASDEIVPYSNETQFIIGNIGYTKLSTIIINENYTGSWKIQFDAKGMDSQTFLQIRKNGVVYGTEQTIHYVEFVTVSETFSNITINSGDKIELWGRSGGIGYVLFFRVLFDYSPVSFYVLYPSNLSTVVNPVSLSWYEAPINSPYTYQIASTSDFSVPVLTSSISPSSPINTVTLPNLTMGTYYWRVKNATGSYNNYNIFSLGELPATPGRFNITAFDEQTGSRVMNFSAQINNATYFLNKTTSTGWVNFSASEVSSGEYLIRIVPTATYAPRSLLATSPDNVSAYVPATTNTINTVAFFLLDYTTLYPYSTTKFTLIKNNTVMYSAYFDAEAKTTAYLIQGDSYKITLTNGNNIQEWGNYIAVSSGNVEISVTNIGIPDLGKYNYNISTRPGLISFNWSSLIGSVYFTILKNTTKTTVHQLVTTVGYGQSNYIITTPDIYYITMTANTGGTTINRSFVYDTRPANSSTIIGRTWGYGSFVMPQQYMNYGTMVFIIILAGIFGAMYATLGAVVLILTTLFAINSGWLAGSGIAGGFIGGLAVLILITYLKDKDSD